MILKTIKDFTLRLIAGANWVTIALMLAVGYSGYLSPLDHPTLSQAHFVFPAIALVNTAFLVFWVLFKPRWVVIPVAGFLAAFQPVHSYLPIHLPEEPPEGSIKVISYNVAGFAHSKMHDDEERGALPLYLVNENADILCLQEAYNDTPTQRVTDQYLNEAYAYRDTALSDGKDNPVALYSKYPIVGKERIFSCEHGNHAAAFHVDIDGDTVIVVNCHLQSLQLSHEDREGFQSMVEGTVGRDSMKTESHKLLDKIRIASEKRAPQAQAVADYIKDNAHRSIIVCGDFNDPPLSYSNHVISRGLTDCFVSAGTGIGYSFHENGMFFRIDNILCSKDWTPYKAKVDRTIAISDHYPIKCWLKKAPKH